MDIADLVVEIDDIQDDFYRRIADARREITRIGMEDFAMCRMIGDKITAWETENGPNEQLDVVKGKLSKLAQAIGKRMMTA